jgi:hypothetical protein
MSRLLLAGGAEFATGEASLTLSPAHAHDRLSRLFVEVSVEGFETSAVIDTGGAYLILHPALATELSLGGASAAQRDRLAIRGITFAGSLHRIPVTLLATAGESLTFEATAFVPELGDGEVWPLPSYLGWQGCLDRIRFAVDPADEVVYFGALAA